MSPTPHAECYLLHARAYTDLPGLEDAPEAREFAQKHRAELTVIPVWVFSSGPLGNENPENPTDLNKLAAPLNDVQIRDHRLFDGELDPEKLGFGERLIVRVVGAPTGDYRDWNEIRSWAAGIVGSLNESMYAPVEKQS